MRINIFPGLLLLLFNNTFCQTKPTIVLFVCEHGSAKSIVAAAHFSRLAKEQGLDIRVISRGINPDASIPDATNNHLVADGFEKITEAPMKLTSADLEESGYVIAFNPLPEKYGRIKNAENWNIPSFDTAYPAAKDSLIININRIIQRIKTDNQK